MYIYIYICIFDYIYICMYLYVYRCMYIYIHKIDMLYAIDMIGFIVRYMQCLKVSPGIQVLRADTWGDSH